MADPANRQPHRIFDLGDLRAWAQLEDAKRALDEQDALEARRFITFFGEDDQLAGEIDFDPPPGLTCLLKPYLKVPLQLDRYAYFLEVHDRNE